MNKDNSVFWYMLSFGVSMCYLPMRGIQFTLNPVQLQNAVDILTIWQGIAVVLSFIALFMCKKKTDFHLSVISLIFAIVLGAIVAVAGSL